MDANVISYFAIIGTLAAAVISPGPSFLIIAKTAAGKSRAEGVMAALGMSVAGQIFAWGALLGLHVFLRTIPWLYICLRITGALYLLYIASLLWRHAATPLVLGATDGASRVSLRKSFMLGFMTQISNPKTILFFASMFSTLLPAVVPRWMLLTLPPSVSMVEFGWYGLAAIALSSDVLSAKYLKLKTQIDRLAAGILCLVALTLIAATLSTL